MSRHISPSTSTVIIHDRWQRIPCATYTSSRVLRGISSAARLASRNIQRTSHAPAQGAATVRSSGYGAVQRNLRVKESFREQSMVTVFLSSELIEIAWRFVSGDGSAIEDERLSRIGGAFHDSHEKSKRKRSFFSRHVCEYILYSCGLRRSPVMRNVYHHYTGYDTRTLRGSP